MIRGWKEDSLNGREETLDNLLVKYIQLYNNCLLKIPGDMTVGIHVCRGNYQGQSFSKGSYKKIAEKLFSIEKINTYYLEYDDQNRTGDFQPLIHFPKEKKVILGVISSKNADLEDLKERKSWIEEAAKYIAQGNKISPEEALRSLGVSTQCGFASHYMGNLIGFDEMEEKLRHVVRLSEVLNRG